MATPLLLSDTDLDALKTVFATHFTDPEPFRKQVEVTRRVSAAVRAIGGATAANAPVKWQYINLFVALDELSNGDYALTNFLAGRLTDQTIPGAARSYHLLLDQSFQSLVVVQMKLFDVNPTHVLLSLLENNKIAASLDTTSRQKVTAALQKAIDQKFVVGKDSMETLIADSAYASSAGSSDAIKTIMRKLARLSVLVRLPQDLAFLWDTSWDSAASIAQLPRTSFVSNMIGRGMLEDSAIAIHDHAEMIDLRNEQAWTALLASKSQWSPALLSALGTTSSPPTVSTTTDLAGQLINYSNLFGDLYINPCEDCSSVTGPAAYYVDLLRMLKNCPCNPTDSSSASLYAKLIERRPDLRDLQLTCANTNVLIPYIDLANEVMESFITNIPTSGTYTTVAIQALDMTDSDQGMRNVSQPQKTQFWVYKEKLDKQTFPLDVFPYNQAIDTARAYASAFGSSRHGIMAAFQSKHSLSSDAGTASAAQLDRAAEVLKYALAAEFLNLLPADVVAITQNSIFPRSYYTDQSGGLPTQAAYNEKIGLGSAHSYWGYSSQDAMLADTSGLSNVTKQFLIRANMSLQDLLDLLQTRFLGGRLVLGNTADAPIFDTDVSDLRLRHPTPSNFRGSLTVSDAYALQAFIRLWRKSGWTMQDLDLGLSCFTDQTAGADTIPLISADSIASLSAVAELQRLTDFSIEKLLPLWGLIDTGGKSALYAKLFLQGNSTNSDPVWGQDSQGRFLTNAQSTLSTSRTAVAAGFGIPDEYFSSVVWGAGVQNDRLNLANLSAIYRVYLFCQIFEISPLHYSGTLKLFAPGFSPFRTPQDTVRMLKEWRSCTQDGIKLPQALFITGIDQRLQMQNPGYGLSDQRALDAVCAIVTGLLQIEKSVPIASAITPSMASVAELVRIASLVYDPTLGPQVSDFVEGTGTTPRSSANPIYQNVLLRSFQGNEVEARSILFEQTQPTGTEEEVAIALEIQSVNRRLLFLRAVNPVLKARLTNELIVNCIASLLPGNDAVLARTLVSDVVRNASTNESAFKVLGGLLNTNNQAPVSAGPAYFRPPSTDTYKFYFADATGTRAPSVTVDGIALTWTRSGGGWSSNELKLNNGESYALRSSTPNFTTATFSNVRSAGLAFSSDVLIYSKTLRDAVDVILPLLRAAEFIAEFELDVPSILFMHGQAGTTTLAVDFSKITYDDIRKAARYNALRQRTITTELHVVEYFKWAASQDHDTSLEEKLSSLTGISRIQVQDYLSAKFPSLTPTALVELFRNDAEIASLLNAVDFSSQFGIPGVGFKLLFKWAKPLEPTISSQYYDAAAEVRQIAQLLPLGDLEDNPIVKANNVIRTNQRQALATYLLQQDYMRSRGILDFGQLFEYFLIDVQMGACLQTSRLKQAISAVQLYIQRCILGLEKSRGVSSGTVNLARWAWMQKYRLWEANRKVFLYPENWLEPSLRDNKSEVFQAFEADLLQIDINEESIKKLIRNYIYGANTVANLDVQAYSWDRRSDTDGTLHFFARTRQAPYTYFYRSAVVSGSPASAQVPESYTRWTAWSRIDIDIPTIESDVNGVPLPLPGAYLAPAIKDKRLFLFLPTIMIKSTVPTTGTKSFREMAESTASSTIPSQYWQIQMAWTEYQNGNWSPKVLAPAVLTVAGARAGDFAAVPFSTSVWDSCPWKPTVAMVQEATKMPSASTFRFSTYTRRGSGDLSVVTIVVDRWLSLSDGKFYRYVCGAFELRGEQLVLLDRGELLSTRYGRGFTETVPSRFNKVLWNSTAAPTYQSALNDSGAKTIYWGTAGAVPTTVQRPKFAFTMSFDLSNSTSALHGLVVDVQYSDRAQTLFNQVTTTGTPNNTYNVTTSEEMSNTIWPRLVNATTTNAKLDPAYAVLSTNIADITKHQLFGTQNVQRNETSMPAAIYTWEMGIHIIMLLMERLRDLQQFELGMSVARYVFDPTIDGSNLNRCWGFLPFKEIAGNPIPTTESLLKSLSASSGAESTMSPNVLASRENPFNAHVIARGRPSAYMKRFVMTYIELLIGSGDEYFRQNTLESIPLAIQQYVQASHLFGPAPRPLPKIGRKTARSYAQLETAFNDFSNTTFDLELDFPFWCDPSKRGGAPTNLSASHNLTGMLRSTYFCVPTNPKLVQLKSLIDDRLFKIRNCQDINGVTRSLSLFEPPIDVGTAIKAMAAGINVNALLNDSVGPMPNFRFAPLLEKALDICSELKNVGAVFQAAKETRDAEALAALQAKQDRVMQEMTMATKVLARKEILGAIEELKETRKSHVTRLQFYLALTGDKKRTPDEKSDWDDIAQTIENPSTDGQATTASNRLEMSSTDEARRYYKKASAVEGVAAVIKAIPDISTEIEPFGCGCEIGGITGNISDSMTIAAGVIRSKGDDLMIQAGQAARKADFVGQLQERRMEANSAGRDIKIVDKQIATLNVSLSICDEDIRQQNKMIEFAATNSEFLRTKYTSEQLYIWMDGQVRNLFYQTYLLANDLAKKAQKLYRFERVKDSTDYIAQSYWNASRDGLLSGENLYLALKRLEAAYDANKGHDFEITKNVSLRKLQPLALMNLRETGTAYFTLPEVLFDYDYPGHYMRRIKTLSVSIPTASDIGTDMYATLRLMEHRYRIEPTATGGQDYLMRSVDDSRFRTDQIPITAIAVSQVTDDSGTFDYELEFNDYLRYVPFEGAGAVSKWQIELPTAVKQFDYSLINDVVIKLKYTSMYGGVGFRKSAAEAARAYQTSVANLSTSEGLFTFIDVRNDFPAKWATFSAKSAIARTVELPDLLSRLPFFIKGRQVKVETVTAFISADTAVTWTSNLTLTSQASVTWKAGFDVGQFKTVTQNGMAEKFEKWTVGLTSAGGNAGLQNLIFVVRYYLQ